MFDSAYDDARDEPLYAVILSTRRILNSCVLTRSIEIDETFKVIYESHPVTAIGYIDMDRAFHVLAIGVSTNSTQEVGEFFLRALLKEVPNLRPAAYLGDSAEAFANAARVVWPGIRRLMCYAHVYKVSITLYYSILHKDDCATTQYF